MLTKAEQKTETFDVKKSIEAQEKMCNEEGYPHFAPSTGVCWRCQSQIYAVKYWKATNRYGGRVPGTESDHTSRSGISTEMAAHHVTGCPHCFWSYCD